MTKTGRPKNKEGYKRVTFYLPPGDMDHLKQMGQLAGISASEYLHAIILSVDGKEITLTVKGARDLALALRQSSNRIERYTFDRLGKGTKNHLR